MAAPKRTKMQRERDLEVTADMYCKGKTQVAIAAHIGVSQSQISFDLKEIVSRWQEKAAMAIDQRKAEELAKIDRLEAEYWRGWEGSLKATEIASMSQSDDGKKSASKRTISQYGDPRFLAGVAQCIEMRCKILGVNAPTKISATIEREHEYTPEETRRIAAELAGRKN